MSIRRALVVLASGAIALAVVIAPRLPGVSAAPTSQKAAATWIFQGRVYAGDVGDESTPLEGVTVAVYGANSPYPDPGTLIASTVTNSEGWYGLEAPDTFEYS